MRFSALVAGLLLIAPIAIEAQAKTTARPTARATVVKRKGTPDEIAAARDVAIAALATRWSGGFQSARAGGSACELLLLSRKTVGDMVTTDVQTVDVGRLGTDIERVRDPLAGTDDLRIGMTSGEAEVSRRRERVLEGAPQRPIEEKVLFLALISGRDAGRNDEGAAALIGWSIPCERVR